LSIHRGYGDEGEANSLFAVLRAAGVPIMGHIGFTPQSALSLDGVVQGKTFKSAKHLFYEAETLERAGCFAVVLEAIAEEVARVITEKRAFATVGIGAGNGCDGQVLVWHDLVGISQKNLKMARAFAQTRTIWMDALREYKQEVEARAFPNEENLWHMVPAELEQWQQEGVVVNYRGQEYMDGQLEVEPFEGDRFWAWEKEGGGWEADSNPDVPYFPDDVGGSHSFPDD